jgi:hypothetical protein
MYKKNIHAGGCCIPITMRSTMAEFVNDSFFPNYIAGNWSQSSITATYNGRLV